MPLGSLTSVPGADLEGLILDHLARPAARTVRFHLVAAGPADDDQQVLVNPADFGAGQAGQERRDGRAQLCRTQELLEDLADGAAARQALDEPGEDIPAGQFWTELGLM